MTDKNGVKYDVRWDKSSGNIDFIRDGKKIGSTTMNEVRAQYAEAMKEKGQEGPTARAASTPNKCDVIMAGAGTANGILWTAAGLTAVAPPAAVAAAVGGTVTTGIITVGNLFAC